MPAKPRGERGWWFERYSPLTVPTCYGEAAGWGLADPEGTTPVDVSHQEVALWRLARMHRREVERLNRENYTLHSEVATLRLEVADLLRERRLAIGPVRICATCHRRHGYTADDCHTCDACEDHDRWTQEREEA